MGVVLCLTAPAAIMDPLVESGNYMVTDNTTASNLVLCFQHMEYDMEMDPTPTIPRHGLVHLDDVMEKSSYKSYLCTSCSNDALGSSLKHLIQYPYPLPLPFVNLLIQ